MKTDQLIEKMRPDTGAVILNHCSNVTGVLNEVEKIGEAAKYYGIPFILDAAQSAGVYPIDAEKMNIDILAVTGHKSLLGIQGIGALFIREGLKLQPLKSGGTGSKSDSAIRDAAPF